MTVHLTKHSAISSSAAYLCTNLFMNIVQVRSMSRIGVVAGAGCVHAKQAAASAPFLAHKHLGQRIQSQLSASWSRLPHVSPAPSRRLMSESSQASQPAAPPQAPQVASGASGPAQQDFLVQYVVVRKDLWGGMGWPLGSVVAQACHASSAAIWTFRDEEATQKYLAPDNIDHMRKVRHSHPNN